MVGIILTPDNRSKAYIQKLISNKIKLEHIILMNKEIKEKSFSENEIKISKSYGFDISESVIQTLVKNNLAYKEFDFIDINHPELIKYVSKINLDYCIFAGGGILKHQILNLSTKFIHLHPGIVPYYRGSTCFYYSILKDDNCGVSAYLMDENLDTGDLILQLNFPKPSHIYLDDIYDPHIRSETLVAIFRKKLLEKKKFQKQDKSNSWPFFIIHPVLKHIAILRCVK